MFDRQRLRYPLSEQKIDFLHCFLSQELADRLGFVSRDFKNAAIFSDHSEAMAAIWQQINARFWFAAPSPQGSVDLVCDEALPFAQSLDLAISLNGLHLTDNPVAALAQFRGALKPDGLFLGAACAAGTLRELADALLQAESALSGGAAMRVAPFADVSSWAQALQSAGFALPVADEVTLTVRYKCLTDLFRDLEGMGGRAVLAQRVPAPRRLFERAEAVYRELYSDPDGKLRATFTFACLSGWAPHPSQQQPAKRGSGTMSLEEALRKFGG